MLLTSAPALLRCTILAAAARADGCTPTTARSHITAALKCHPTAHTSQLFGSATHPFDLLSSPPSLQVGYFHAYQDGVDYVFVDHACYHAFASELIYVPCRPCACLAHRLLAACARTSRFRPELISFDALLPPTSLPACPILSRSRDLRRQPTGRAVPLRAADQGGAGGSLGGALRRRSLRRGALHQCCPAVWFGAAGLGSAERSSKHGGQVHAVTGCPALRVHTAQHC